VVGPSQNTAFDRARTGADWPQIVRVAKKSMRSRHGLGRGRLSNSLPTQYEGTRRRSGLDGGRLVGFVSLIVRHNVSKPNVARQTPRPAKRHGAARGDGASRWVHQEVADGSVMLALSAGRSGSDWDWGVEPASEGRSTRARRRSLARCGQTPRRPFSGFAFNSASRD